MFIRCAIEPGGKSVQTKAAILRKHGIGRPYHETSPLSIETITLSEPGPGEVLVAMAYAGLCHSDLSTINGDRLRPVPMVLGHEASGRIVACGPGVTDLVPGDPVVMVFVPSCGHCLPCAEGRPALCEPGAAANGAGTLLSGDRRLADHTGLSLHHHLGVSGFAGHAVVSRRSVVPIPRDLPLDQAALFGCAVLTGVGAVVNTAAVSPGTRVAVVGLGGVGLAALLGAVAAGASTVIAVDPLAEKLALARTLGATATVAAGPSAAEEIRDLTRGGVDFAFEMAGVPAAFDTAWRATRRGGMVVTAGLPHPDQRWALPLTQLVAEERTVRGSYIGSCVPIRDIPRYIALFQQARMPVDRLLGQIHPFEDINLGFEQLAAGATLRQLVQF